MPYRLFFGTNKNVKTFVRSEQPSRLSMDVVLVGFMVQYLFAFAVLGSIGAFFIFLKAAGKEAESSVSPSYENIYEFTATSLDGNEIDLKSFKGKVVLIVNTASNCGFTPQYAQLQELYAKYKDQGLVVLGFPSNEFMQQEPCSNREIAEFCKLNYGVTFPMFQKGSVKGRELQPLFSYLTTSGDKKLEGKIRWNFEKFLVGKDGKLITRFRSLTKPNSKKLIEPLEEALNA